MANKKTSEPKVGSASDYVNDPVFGVVPKDNETALKLRRQAREKHVADPTITVPHAIEEKVADKA